MALQGVILMISPCGHSEVTLFGDAFRVGSLHQAGYGMVKPGIRVWIQYGRIIAEKGRKVKTEGKFKTETNSNAKLDKKVK